MFKHSLGALDLSPAQSQSHRTTDDDVHHSVGGGCQRGTLQVASVWAERMAMDMRGTLRGRMNRISTADAEKACRPESMAKAAALGQWLLHDDICLESCRIWLPKNIIPTCSTNTATQKWRFDCRFFEKGRSASQSEKFERPMAKFHSSMSKIAGLVWSGGGGGG